MDKQVIITNGVGTGALANRTYSVLADVNGYENTSINPSSVTITSDTDEYSFTISANGTLTVHVTEDGTITGTPIVGATFSRTDSLGTEYGPVITTDAQGNALFENVPYDSVNAPVIYFKQTASDGNHEFDPNVNNITLTTQTDTTEVINLPVSTRTINLTDANYQNLPIESGTLTFSNS